MKKKSIQEKIADAVNESLVASRGPKMITEIYDHGMGESFQASQKTPVADVIELEEG